VQDRERARIERGCRRAQRAQRAGVVEDERGGDVIGERGMALEEGRRILLAGALIDPGFPEIALRGPGPGIDLVGNAMDPAQRIPGDV
jgi:hypothetical protein